MSAAILTAPTARPAELADQVDGEYISLAEAARLSGLHQTTILRMALSGDIRHRVRGRRTMFHAEDVRRSA